MLKKIKQKLSAYLFKEQRDLLVLKTNRLNYALKKVEDNKGSLSIVDLVREQLGGFDTKLLDSSEDLDVIYEAEDGESALLSGARELHKNKHLGVIAQHLIRNQVLYIAKDAEAMESVNFGRATINGIELFIEEIERLNLVYEELHKGRDDFDEHEVI